METIKVDLPEDNTVEFYAFMKHKTQKAVEELTRQYLTYPEGAGKLKVTQGNDGEPSVKSQVAVEELEVTVDLNRINWIAVDEAIILNQVATWSFGEVTAEVLGNQSEDVFKALKAKVNELYKGSFPLAKRDGAN